MIDHSGLSCIGSKAKKANKWKDTEGTVDVAFHLILRGNSNNNDVRQVGKHKRNRVPEYFGLLKLNHSALPSLRILLDQENKIEKKQCY